MNLAFLFAFFSKILTLVEGFWGRKFSKENIEFENAKKNAKIWDEAERAAKLANSDDEVEKQSGVDAMRDLISD